MSRPGHVWAPEGSTAFKCLVSARFCAGLLSNISDCDETYNYWEPTHYLLYRTGMQTWEYSPAYAIPSYAYLWLHTLPACFPAKILQTNKVLVFYFLCGMLAFTCCVCELYFYNLPPQYLLYVQHRGSHDWLVPGAPQSGCFGYCSWSHIGLALQCPAGHTHCL
ncbi:alpha-1,2-mannosyltransferase ALG9-like [Xyrauchen texanus]|uniref:alpha-1,2-mannosyltransferase ALG9-like n=1 Tax=Xyrauchen texanus TaxID=154827 RepID=UPI0022421643|nr:alpha-1,2-mannosyltransferase ALG9-like [Xyrauchen texanus]